MPEMERPSLLIPAMSMAPRFLRMNRTDSKTNTNKTFFRHYAVRCLSKTFQTTLRHSPAKMPSMQDPKCSHTSEVYTSVSLAGCDSSQLEDVGDAFGFHVPVQSDVIERAVLT